MSMALSLASPDMTAWWEQLSHHEIFELLQDTPRARQHNMIALIRDYQKTRLLNLDQYSADYNNRIVLERYIHRLTHSRI